MKKCRTNHELMYKYYDVVLFLFNLKHELLNKLIFFSRIKILFQLQYKYLIYMQMNICLYFINIYILVSPILIHKHYFCPITITNTYNGIKTLQLTNSF